MEDAKDSDFLETTVANFVKEKNKEIFVDLPNQIEAFPNTFTNDKYTFTVFGDAYTNQYRYKKDYQLMDKDKMEMFQKRQIYKFQDMGFFLDNPKTFVSYNIVNGVAYDGSNDSYYKLYSEDIETAPLSMIMRRRSP